MEKIINIVMVALILFFIWGAFFVNFPAENYIWGIYDLFMAGVIGFLLATN
jgi:hypothetical protein